MAAASFIQTSFLGGEVSKSIQGRFDDDKYRTWLNTCLNSMPLSEGPWTRRPGSMHCGHTRNGGPGRVVSFNFKQANPYTIELTAGFMRFRDAPVLVTSNDDQAVSAISSATPPRVTTSSAHGWQGFEQVFFKDLGVNNPTLQNRVFIIAVFSATQFDLYDPVTNSPIDGSTIGTFVSGNVARVLEIATPYVGTLWQTVRVVQADIPQPNGVTPGAFFLHGSVKPYFLEVVTPPTATEYATFNFEAASFKDGPYLDPVPGGTLATPSGLTGNVTLTLSFNAWSATTSYSEGDYVVSASVNYRSLTDANLNNVPPNATHWVAVSAADAIGPNGFTGSDIGRHVRMFSEPAIWASGTAYAKDAVVAYGGSGNQYIGATYWISLTAGNTGNIPGADLTKWAIYPNGARWTWGKILGLSNIIDRSLAGSTSIGDMTSGGGLAAAFDGVIAQVAASSAEKSVVLTPVTPPTLTSYVGKNYTAASDQVIAQAVIYPSSDQGLTNDAAGNFGGSGPGVTSIVLNLRGKASAPASASDGTLLGTTTLTSDTTSPVTIISSDQTTAWKYVWIEQITTFTTAGSFTITNSIAELSFFAPTGTGVSQGVSVQIIGDPLLYTTAIRVWRLGTYSDTTGWPTCGTWHEGRLWLAGVVANRIDSSKSNEPFNFAPTNPDGSVSANNGISYTFNSPDVNPIFWMSPEQLGIICGTQAGEWLVQATNNNLPLTPTTIQAHMVSTYHCANIEPRRANLTLAVVQAYRRDLLEMFADVFSGKFNAHDLNYTAKHMVRARISEIAYQQEFIPIVWARLGNGNLIGCTYSRTSLVSSQPPEYAGWHRHTLGSGRTVESICMGASPDGTIDSLFMVTNESSTGIRHVECLTNVFYEGDDPADAWFLDNAVEPSSTTSSNTPSVGAPFGGLTINGLWHLNGQTVQVYAGGLDCGQGELGTDPVDFLVTAGSVFVPYGDGVSAGSGGGLFTEAFALTNPPIVVGFTYTSDGQIVRPNAPGESGARNGPAFGKLRRVQQYALQVDLTAGLSIGTSANNLDPVLFNAEGGPALPFGDTFSGIYRAPLSDDNTFDGMLFWRVTRPVPATISTVGGFIHTQDI